MYIKQWVVPGILSGGGDTATPSTLLSNFSVPQISANTGLALRRTAQEALKCPILYDCTRDSKLWYVLSWSLYWLTQLLNSLLYLWHSSGERTSSTTENPWFSNSARTRSLKFDNWMSETLKRALRKVISRNITMF